MYAKHTGCWCRCVSCQNLYIGDVGVEEFVGRQGWRPTNPCCDSVGRDDGVLLTR